MTPKEHQELVEELQGGIRDALSHLVGSVNLNESGLAVIRATMNGHLRDMEQRGRLPYRGAWEMARFRFASQGFRLDDDGRVYGNDGTEDFFCGTVSNVKFGTGVQQEGDTIYVDLLEYDYELAHPVKRISVDFDLVTQPPRDYQKDPLTAKEFRALHGRDPELDDLERINCPCSGGFGHWQCGLCPEHNKARFECGCLRRSTDGR